MSFECGKALGSFEFEKPKFIRRETMKRIVLLILLVGLMASVASATWYWEGDVSSSWADVENWNNGSGTPTVPHTLTERLNVPGTTGVYPVSVDTSDQIGFLHMGRNDNGGTLSNAEVNLDTAGVTLIVSTGSGELVSVAYSDNLTNNLNVSAGRLDVYRGTGVGELRLNHVYNATCVGNVNLSGTGIIDVEYLNKGGRDGGGNFYATGGNLIVRARISKFGLTSAGYSGFNLGGATLEIASWSDRSSAVGSIDIGGNEATDFFMDSTSAVKFDLGLSANNGGVAGTDYDLIVSRGNYAIAGELMVNFLAAPTVGDYWDVWTVMSGHEGAYDGSGAFNSLPSNIQASWIDTGTGNDTLRLTYVPEPATLILLGLGAIAIRRNKKQ